MPTGFEDAFTDMADVIDAFTGLAVTLTRTVPGPGGSRVLTCEVTAVLGRVRFSRNRQGDGSPSIEYGDGDWFVRAVDYRLGGAGEAVEPAAGDRLLDQVAGRLFEVKPILGAPSWEWSEPERLTYRIHTTEIQEDPA